MLCYTTFFLDNLKIMFYTFACYDVSPHYYCWSFMSFIPIDLVSIIKPFLLHIVTVFTVLGRSDINMM